MIHYIAKLRSVLLGKSARLRKKLRFDLFCLSTMVFIITLAFWKLFFGLRLDVWQRIKLPFGRTGDALVNLILIKSLHEGSWLPYFGIHSPRLNAPFGFDLADFPIPDNLVLSIWAVMGRFTSNPFFVLNGYFYLTYLMNAVSFYLVCRRLRFHGFTAMVLGILYTFLPYHFLRYNHIFLASYFLIPWMVLILIRLWGKNPPFLRYDCLKAKYTFIPLFSFTALTCLFFMFGSGGIYYCFFFCFLLFVASISGTVYRQRLVNLKSGLFCVFVTVCALLFSLLPNLIKIFLSGKNVEATFRTADGAVKITKFPGKD